MRALPSSLLRRQSGLLTPRCAPRGLALACPAGVQHRPLHTEVILDEESEWNQQMKLKYGSGTFQLFRPLYKDLCDEIRREYYTKPPPPYKLPGESRAASTRSAPSRDADHTATEAEDAEAEGEEGQRVGGSGPEPAPQAAETSPPQYPSPTYGDGSWSVAYQPENNFVVFRREAVEEERMGRVVAFSRIVVEDPPKLNALLKLADWYAIEVLVERKGVIVHFSIASNEGGMHMRNVRVYDATADPTLMECTDDAAWVRHNLFYDGPCLWHLELDMQNELYDIMQDHGVNMDWVRWAAEWVFYLEHVQYTKWSLGMLEELIPRTLRGPEEDFLLEREKAALEEPVSDWLPSHTR